MVHERWGWFGEQRQAQSARFVGEPLIPLLAYVLPHEAQTRLHFVAKQRPKRFAAARVGEQEPCADDTSNDVPPSVQERMESVVWDGVCEAARLAQCFRRRLDQRAAMDES
jgi:hypothetical protein